jgi:hypothetical protein
MSGLNQTGPMGQGAMTGRKMGKCTNFAAKNEKVNDSNLNEADTVKTTNQKQGLGQGQGQGRGMCAGGRGKGLGRANGRGNGRGKGTSN